MLLQVNIELHYLFRFLYGDQARFFTDEIHLDLKHSKMGTVAMANAGENLNASQVFSPLFLGFWWIKTHLLVTFSGCGENNSL